MGGGSAQKLLRSCVQLCVGGGSAQKLLRSCVQLCAQLGLRTLRSGTGFAAMYARWVSAHAFLVARCLIAHMVRGYEAAAPQVE